MNSNSLAAMKKAVDEEGRAFMYHLKRNMGTFAWWFGGLLQNENLPQKWQETMRLKSSTSIPTYNNLRREFESFRTNYKTLQSEANSYFGQRNQENIWKSYFARMDEHIAQTQTILNRFGRDHIEAIRTSVLQ